MITKSVRIIQFKFIGSINRYWSFTRCMCVAGWGGGTKIVKVEYAILRSGFSSFFFGQRWTFQKKQKKTNFELNFHLNGFFFARWLCGQSGLNLATVTNCRIVSLLKSKRSVTLKLIFSSQFRGPKEPADIIVTTVQRIFYMLTFFPRISFKATEIICKMMPNSKCLVKNCVFFNNANNFSAFCWDDVAPLLLL